MIDPALAGLLTAAGGVGIAYLAHRAGRRKDRVTEQSGVVTQDRAGTAQIIEGLNLLIDQLQEDYARIREDLQRCAARLDPIATRLEEALREIARLRHKYGENGGTP